MLQLDPSSLTGGKKPYGFPVHKPHFYQVKRDVGDLGFGLDELP
ncbi:MAG: hypothetical protein ABSH13_05175 [Candidatus Acidiferrum sp.]|jgi:hypothetical protein